MDTIKSLRRKLTIDTEDNSGDYTEETGSPLVDPKDLYDGFVQVEIFIPGLEPGKDKHHPKGGSSDVVIFNNGRSLNMRTELVDKIKKVKNIWEFNVQQLPGRVENKSKWVVEKGKIIITLEKHQDDQNIDWKPAIDSRGLDQLSSSSSSDDD